MRFLINNERFDEQAYGDESIARESRLIFQQFDKDNPSWIGYSVTRGLVHDETSMIQLG